MLSEKLMLSSLDRWKAKMFLYAKQPEMLKKSRFISRKLWIANYCQFNKIVKLKMLGKLGQKNNRKGVKVFIWQVEQKMQQEI